MPATLAMPTSRAGVRWLRRHWLLVLVTTALWGALMAWGELVPGADSPSVVRPDL